MPRHPSASPQVRRQYLTASASPPQCLTTFATGAAVIGMIAGPSRQARSAGSRPLTSRAGGLVRTLRHSFRTYACSSRTRCSQALHAQYNQHLVTWCGVMLVSGRSAHQYQVVVLGGNTTPMPSIRDPLRALALNGRTLEYELLQVEGTPPYARTQHSATLVDGEVVLVRAPGDPECNQPLYSTLQDTSTLGSQRRLRFFRCRWFRLTTVVWCVQVAGGHCRSASRQDLFILDRRATTGHRRAVADRTHAWRQVRTHPAASCRLPAPGSQRR